MMICIGIGGPLELISRTTSGPRSKLWKSLVYLKTRVLLCFLFPPFFFYVKKCDAFFVSKNNEWDDLLKSNFSHFFPFFFLSFFLSFCLSVFLPLSSFLCISLLVLSIGSLSPISLCSIISRFVSKFLLLLLFGFDLKQLFSLFFPK